VDQLPFFYPITGPLAFLAAALPLGLAAWEDRRSLRLPNWLLATAVLAGLLVELACRLWLPAWSGRPDQTAGAAAVAWLPPQLAMAAVVLAAMAAFRRLVGGRFGLGDVKCIAACAVFLPAGGLFAMLFLACILAMLWFHALPRPDRRFAFGPFLVLAFAVVDGGLLAARALGWTDWL
jgi:Flp pilus assembly protein protease CpaA